MRRHDRVEVPRGHLCRAYKQDCAAGGFIPRNEIRSAAGLYLRMALIGRLHPVLVHFPIALIVAAFGCELVSMATRLREWHVAAVANLRIGAVFAVGSAIAGGFSPGR